MIKSFAFLDEGSSMTLMDEDLAKQEKDDLCIEWAGDTTRVEPASMMIDLQIGAVASTKRFDLKVVRTVTSLRLPQQTFTMDDERWDHPKQPVAVKTRLGWCVCGKTAGSQIERVLHMCECGASDENSTIQGAFCKFYDLEQLGTVFSDVPDPDERRALTILETTTVRIANRFESGLLWKTANVELPTSLSVLRRRLECLERRMERDPKLKTVVHHHIAGMMERVTSTRRRLLNFLQVIRSECGTLRWEWLPIRRSLGRCTSSGTPLQGTTLNDMLLKGLNELVSLPRVLFRFRMYGIAVCVDVKEMFLQIRMRDEDKHAQRFLWREDPADDIATYFVDVVTFGSACFPESDASQLPYTCVLYLRVVDSAGEPHCTMLCEKAKVAPLKPLTIPKMELQACFPRNSIPVKKRVLLTDSTVALSWIHADPRNYRPFVANRVAEIQENINVNEWRWVPTQDNPADEATKWKGRANSNWDGI
uniref:Peptidase aspartic putative domain-containing protein n=1 Tax=Anopheles quadriannulatus TaxID=34691 RepID=A0A182XPH2_ANOQN